MKLRTFLFFALFVSSFVVAQGPPDLGKKMTNKEIKLLIDSVSTVLRRAYIFPDKAEIMIKALNEQYKSGDLAKMQNRRDLGDMMNFTLRKAHFDGHMSLFYNPGFANDLMTQLPDSLQKKFEERMLLAVKNRNFSFVKTEILPGNIGYLRWDGFEGDTKEATPTFESAFRFVANSSALIIDMRYNGGGSPITVLAMQNYFYDSKVPMNHIIDFKKDTNWRHTDPSKTNFKLKMPVYILTSRRTFSGAEDFTYGLKYGNKRAIVVGDTTGGGAHPTGPMPMGQGFILNVPTARSTNEVTHDDWEGKGVYPDVYVNSTTALEKTQTLILKDLITKADGQEKIFLQWNLNVAENKAALAKGIPKLSAEALQKLCGEYKPIPGPGASPYLMNIILKEGYVYRSIPIPPDMKLIPISETRFVYDNDEFNRYLDFLLDKDGKVTGIMIYRTDGTFKFEKVK